MKNKFLKKLIGMSAAASLGCTAVISSGAFFMSSSAAEANVTASENVVDVIVKLKGDTVLDAPAVASMGTDFIRTPGAASIASDLKASQKAVQEKIRGIYPGIEVKSSFVLTMNGFSCSLPKASIPAVEALPEVEYVYEDKMLEKPEMATAPEFASIPTFYQETGCTGEGIVVTIIDSELDITHPMFQDLDPSVKTSVTKEDIKYISENIGFNVDISPDKAYLNSKVPFCASYSGDPYLDVPDDRLPVYHGTHVAGIAAGNEYEGPDGRIYSGVAKDAQVFFMAIHEPEYNDGSVSYEAAISAVEDSIKLGTDIISMSFGSNVEEYDAYPINDAYAAAEKAGIIMLKAGGNEGHIGNTSVLRPDDGTVCNTYSDSVMYIGSAENDQTYGVTGCVISHDGEELQNSGGINVETNKLYNISDNLSGEYSYECFGFGTPEDFEGVDLTGKIAVINRGGEPMFEEKYDNAVAAGAAGVLIVNYPDESFLTMSSYNNCNMSMISYEDGQKLINAENKVITIGTSFDDTLDTEISSFSSWGPTVTLDIKPDILGIGGKVLSAGYEDSVRTMSGTSMSTPYTAGCTAILLQYLEENGMKEKTPERAAYVRKLLMNSANLLTRDGYYISPREQGAGLVSLENAVNEKVILTGSEGKAKVNLYDGIKNSLSFTVDAENFSGEDVSFKSAKLVLAADGYEVDPNSARYYVSGQIELKNNADLSELLNLKAGEKKSLTVDCALDKAQLDEIGKVYENGFYIYGFIVLEGAENCCDTSIPVLGFRGDWNKLEILDLSNAIPYTVFGTRTVPRMRSFMEEVMMWANLRERLTELLPEGFELTSDNYFPVLKELLEPGEFDRLIETADKAYVSHDGDGINDILALDVTYDRFADVKLNITDDKGNSVDEELIGPCPKGSTILVTSPFDPELAEGSYSLDLTASTKNAPDIEEKDSYGFVIDDTAPELEVKVEKKKDGKRIMTVSASDDQALDGVMIMGSGKGKRIGASDDVKYNYFAVADDMLSLFDDAQSFPEYDYTSANRTVFDSLLAGWIDPEDAEKITFSDIVLPGEDGKVSFEYDVTDLEVFAVTALDKAYNTTEEYVDVVSEEKETITPGIWADEDGFYQFNEDGSVDIRMYDQTEGIELAGEYKDGVLKVFMNGEETSSAKPTIIYDDAVVFQDGEDPDDVNVLYFITSDKSLDEIGFYSPLQLIQGIIENQIRTQGVCWPYNDTTYCGGTKFEIKSYASYDPESDNNTPSHIYFADILTGIVTDSNGMAINVKDKTISDFTYFQKGVWVGNADNDVMYFFFDSTNQTGYIKYASDGSLEGFDYDINEDNSLTLYTGYAEFTLRTEYRIDITTFEEYLDVYSEDGSVQTLTFNRDLRPLRFEYCNYRELSAMAVKDYAAKHDGSEPSEANFRANDDNTVDIELSKNGKVVETYTIDPVTAQGTDSEGNDVELPQTGNNSPVTAAETACAFLLMIGGVFALVKSGMFRRKDEE